MRDAVAMDHDAMSHDHFEINRRTWDERVTAHALSPEYGLARFTADPTFVSDVVRFDLPRLGLVSGLDGIHLQCHIGTDTVSLARLGARMTGLDFSEPALGVARALARSAGAEVEFVRSNVYDAVRAVGGRTYDLVFTGVGALCWLPAVAPWAEVVAALLRPGGRLFIREGHPMLWSIDDRVADGRLVVSQTYFELPEPDIFDEPGTYVTTDIDFEHNETREWNHGLAEIISALLAAGLTITAFEEHRSVPWQALGGDLMVVDDDGEWRLREQPERLPLTYTLQAMKPNGA
jgi:SAM-dependent methyltransferase